MGTVKWRFDIILALAAKALRRPGPSNIEMHVTDSVPSTLAQGLCPLSISAACLPAATFDMGLKRRKVTGDSAAPECSGCSKRAGAEPRTSLLLAKLAAAEARAEAALNAEPVLSLVPLAQATAIPPTSRTTEKGGQVSDSSSSSSSDGSSSSEVEMTGNEGEETEVDEVTFATYDVRGSACLVTCSCPKQYPRELEDRKRKGQLIPEDMSTEEFLTKLRRVINTKSPVTLVKGTCHDEPHKLYRRARDGRERHKHGCLLLSGNFAHKKVADELFKETHFRISFSFKLKRFFANLAYCMTPWQEILHRPRPPPGQVPSRFGFGRGAQVC